jgi:uncharacterized protein (DUF2267 family)
MRRTASFEQLVEDVRQRAPTDSLDDAEELLRAVAMAIGSQLTVKRRDVVARALPKELRADLEAERAAESWGLAGLAARIAVAAGTSAHVELERVPVVCGLLGQVLDEDAFAALRAELSEELFATFETEPAHATHAELEVGHAGTQPHSVADANPHVRTKLSSGTSRQRSEARTLAEAKPRPDTERDTLAGGRPRIKQN